LPEKAAALKTNRSKSGINYLSLDCKARLNKTGPSFCSEILRGEGMKRLVNAVLVLILIFQFILLPVTQAEIDANSGSYTVKRDEPSYKTGSVFISSNKKNEVLLKANVWGAVQFPGVHYIPMGTRFLDMISFAGGPLDSADTSSITLSTKTITPASKETLRELSVSDALISEKNNPVIQPDDIIVVKESRVRDNISLFLAIGTFLISAAALGLVISEHH
jgi:hypothetical protein